MKSRAFIKIAFLLVIQIAILTSCKDASVKTKFVDQLISEVADSLITQNEHIESISIGILNQGGQYLIQKGVLLNRSSPDAQTLFEIASLTKTFLGTLISKAVNEGKINLDQDIRTYMEGGFENLEKEEVPITLRHLATHRSGLPLFFPYEESIFSEELNWDLIPFQINQMQKGMDKNEFFTHLAGFQLAYTPGTEVLYSNVGANLAGYILESIYNKSIDELMIEVIFGALNMSHTYTRLSDADSTLVAKGKNENGMVMPYRAEKEINVEGGFVSSLPDMLKYMKYQLDTSREEHKLSHIDICNDDLDYHKGLFWQLGKIDGEPMIYQIGGAYGTSSKLTILPSRDMALLIITNASGDLVHSELEKLSLVLIDILKKRT